MCRKERGARASIRCREMGTAEPAFGSWTKGVEVMFLFAVARWGQRNSSPSAAASPGGRSVSIRCREMGTAELQQLRLVCHRLNRFLFAVARWGQRNQPTLFRVVPQPSRFLFAVARWGQRNPSRLLVGPHRHRFLFAVARWGQRNTGRRDGRGLNMSFYSLSRDGDSGTRP